MLETCNNSKNVTQRNLALNPSSLTLYDYLLSHLENRNNKSDRTHCQ